MGKSIKPKKPRGAALDNGSEGTPTPERLRQGDIVMVEERDAAGWPVQRCQVTDIVGRLLRNGLLAADWAGAATRFRRDYRQAHYHTLGVNDLSRPRGAGGHGPILDHVEDARIRIADALAGLGGIASPAGSIVWHVVGAEMTLAQWRDRERMAGRVFRHEMAEGILIGAMGTLAGHYAGGRRPRRVTYVPPKPVAPKHVSG